MKSKVLILMSVGLIAVAGVVVGAIVLFSSTSKPPGAWSSVETRRSLRLDVREDHVVVSEVSGEGVQELFSFSMLAGTTPKLERVDGYITATFIDPNNDTEATATFRDGDPNIWLFVDRKPSTLPREVGKGWIRFPDGELVELLGFDDAGMRNITEPEWISSWTHDPAARMKSTSVTATVSFHPVHQLAPDPQNGRLVWSYPRVDADCDGEEPVAIQGRLVIGEVPLFKISATNFGRDRSVATVFSVPSSGPYAPLDQQDFDARVDVLMNGHTDPKDPRYGNGGLGFANVNTTIFAENFTADLGTDGFANRTLAHCPEAHATALLIGEAEGVRLFSSGAAGTYVPAARPLSAFVSGAFKEPRPGVLDVYHVELAATRDPTMKGPKGAMLKTDGEHWTLSDFATRRLGDVELLNDGEEVEFISALQAADRVRYRGFPEIKWLPNGNLQFKAKEFAEDGFTLLFDGQRKVEFVSGHELKSREGEASTVVWWNFDSSQTYELTFPGQPPIAATDWALVEKSD